jgi:hypothetical protein
MIRRRLLLVLVASALLAVAAQVTAHAVATPVDAPTHATDAASERHVAVPVTQTRAVRAVEARWEPVLGLALAAVVTAFALTRRREAVVPSRRVLWDAGDDWRSLLVGAPPAA